MKEWGLGGQRVVGWWRDKIGVGVEVKIGDARVLDAINAAAVPHFSVDLDGAITQNFSLTGLGPPPVTEVTMETVRAALKKIVDSRETVLVPTEVIAARVRESLGRFCNVVVSDFCPPDQILVLPPPPQWTAEAGSWLRAWTDWHQGVTVIEGLDGS